MYLQALGLFSTTYLSCLFVFFSGPGFLPPTPPDSKFYKKDDGPMLCQVKSMVAPLGSLRWPKVFICSSLF